MEAIPRSLTVSAVADLADIMQPDVNICVLRRRLHPAIQTFAAAAVSRPLRLNRACPAADQGLDEVFGELRGLAGFDAFIADVTFLAELYTTLLDCDLLGVRLHVLRGPMCPRFHIDRVAVRLLCTYIGPTTQWLDDPLADRQLLGAGANGRHDDDSGLIRDRRLVRQARAGDVALLKGEAFPGATGHGVIHRSPPDDIPRLLFSLDALAETH